MAKEATHNLPIVAVAEVVGHDGLVVPLDLVVVLAGLDTPEVEGNDEWTRGSDDRLLQHVRSGVELGRREVDVSDVELVLLLELEPAWYGLCVCREAAVDCERRLSAETSLRPDLDR